LAVTLHIEDSLFVVFEMMVLMKLNQLCSSSLSIEARYNNMSFRQKNKKYSSWQVAGNNNFWGIGVFRWELNMELCDRRCWYGDGGLPSIIDDRRDFFYPIFHIRL
jgi:hypothetical protein